jgi:hypothetical protein
MQPEPAIGQPQHHHPHRDGQAEHPLRPAIHHPNAGGDGFRGVERGVGYVLRHGPLNMVAAAGVPSLYGAVSTPTVAPAMQQAMLAATRLFSPSAVISPRRSGHNAAMPVTMIPTEAKLVKPQSA